MSFILPKVAEPLYELCRVVLVELDIRKVDLENGGARISDVEEHELRLSKVHRSQGAGVSDDG